MEINDIRKIQLLLKTATESINEAMALASPPDGDYPHRHDIYITQQRPKGCKYDDGWQTLFADLNADQAQKWVDSHNEEDAIFPMEYRVKTIDLYLD